MLTPQEAMAPGAPVLHDARPDNAGAISFKIGEGSEEAAAAPGLRSSRGRMRRRPSSIATSRSLSAMHTWRKGASL